MGGCCDVIAWMLSWLGGSLCCMGQPGPTYMNIRGTTTALQACQGLMCTRYLALQTTLSCLLQS